MGFERIGERLGQPLRVGITVVDRRSSRHTEHLDSETSCRSALVEVVVSSPVVARVVVLTGRARQVAGQRRRGVRPRDHDHAGLTDQRSCRRRSARTTCADYTDYVVVSDDRLRSRLATVS